MSAREYPKRGSGERPIYLIAFSANTIRAGQAYWFKDKVLHFVTLKGEERQAPMSSVDRSLTLRLNHDRDVDFQFPVDQ
jgi:hypothetical protein